MSPQVRPYYKLKLVKSDGYCSVFSVCMVLLKDVRTQHKLKHVPNIAFSNTKKERNTNISSGFKKLRVPTVSHLSSYN